MHADVARFEYVVNEPCALSVCLDRKSIIKISSIQPPLMKTEQTIADEKRADELIAQMTPEEKVAQIHWIWLKELMDENGRVLRWTPFFGQKREKISYGGRDWEKV